MYFWYFLIIIIVIILLIRFSMSGKPETHTHPKPIHDQKSGKVKISPSAHANRYDLVLKNSVGGILDEVSKGPVVAFTVLDSVNTFGATKPVVLNTSLATPVESSLLAVMAHTNSVTDPEVTQIAVTNTTTRSFTLVLPNASFTELRVLNVQFLSTLKTFEYKTGDILTINGGQVQGPATIIYQILIYPGSSITPTFSPKLRENVGDGDPGVTLTFSQKSGKFQVFARNNSIQGTNQIYSMNLMTS